MELLLPGLTLIASIGLTNLIRRYLLEHRILDTPNERSSHTVPTPRGGGLAIVIVFLFMLLVTYGIGRIQLSLVLPLLCGGLLTAIAGFLDDGFSLSPMVRVIFYFAAAIIIMLMLGGMPPLNLGFTVWEWGWLGHVIGVIGIVWMINLYNFMDGIDGIAASEAVYVSITIALFIFASTDYTSELLLILLIFAGACGGFLVWNWPKARIFMGDTGSGFLGCILATLAVISARTNPLLLWIWLILLAVFVTDTAVTLVRRILQRKQWYSAHRSHAYQHATIRWQSHRRVTLGVLLINLCWLSVCAALAWLQPSWTLLIVIIAYAPLVGLSLYFRAGCE